MEEHEVDYEPEEPADQEDVITGPEPEEAEPGGPEQEGTEQKEPEAGSEEPEMEPETPEEGAAEEQPEETDAEPEEEPAEEEETEGPGEETVSGNGLVVSGDVVIFPEEYDLSTLGGERADTESIVQAVEEQSDIMTAGFTCTSFMLGILAGALVIAGFRLRRV